MKGLSCFTTALSLWVSLDHANGTILALVSGLKLGGVPFRSGVVLAVWSITSLAPGSSPAALWMCVEPLIAHDTYLHAGLFAHGVSLSALTGATPLGESKAGDVIIGAAVDPDGVRTKLR